MNHNRKLPYLLAVIGSLLTFLPSAALAQGIAPNDPHYPPQWGLHQTDAHLAWSITTGSTRVTTGILDQGIDYTHPDLYLNIWINQEEIPPAIFPQIIDVDGDGLITFWDLNVPINQGPGKIVDLNGNGYIDGGDLLKPIAQGGWADGLDNGSNGYVDDLLGWDFFDNDNDPMDISGHGSAVAGIIGAVGNNGIGVAGVNWKARLMVARMSNGVDPSAAELEARLLGAVDAVAYCIHNGARVINMSGGFPEAILPASVLAAMHAVADEGIANDVLFVASAGNHGLNTDVFPHLPSGLPHENIISVAASFKNDRLAFFGNNWASNFGATTVDLAAPGDYLWTTGPLSFPGTPYIPDFGGTSGATPLVAGAAALLLSVNPDLTFAEVKALILDNVDPVNRLQGIMVTGGRLNIYRAVAAAAQP